MRLETTRVLLRSAERSDAVVLDTIYDGIVGVEFLRSSRSPFNPVNARLYFAPRS